MATYVTSEGDVLDAVCRQHYGPRPGTVEAVLEANPGLADRGPLLPAGVRVELPELAGEPPGSDVVRLWN